MIEDYLRNSLYKDLSLYSNTFGRKSQFLSRKYENIDVILASAFVSASGLHVLVKVFKEMSKTVSGQLSCTRTGFVSFHTNSIWYFKVAIATKVLDQVSKDHRI